MMSEVGVNFMVVTIEFLCQAKLVQEWLAQPSFFERSGAVHSKKFPICRLFRFFLEIAEVSTGVTYHGCQFREQSSGYTNVVIRDGFREFRLPITSAAVNKADGPNTCLERLLYQIIK